MRTIPYIREDQADIRVTVNGVVYGDSWADAEGANLEADDSKTRPGGMGREVSVGGPASRDDLTVQTQLTDVVAGWHKTLENLVSIATRVKVGITFLAPDRTPTGQSQVVQGTLKSAALPDFDHSGNAVGMYKIIVSCDEQAA